MVRNVTHFYDLMLLLLSQPMLNFIECLEAIAGHATVASAACIGLATVILELRLRRFSKFLGKHNAPFVSVFKDAVIAAMLCFKRSIYTC